MLIEGLVITALTAGGLLYHRYLNKRSPSNITANKGSAFARVAEQEGKLIALKAVSSAKKAEALAAHAALDEVDKLLG